MIGHERPARGGSQTRPYGHRILTWIGTDQMIIEDYTPVYFEAMQRGATPSVYDGKFVHVAGPQDEFLLLSPTEFCKYHAHIVAHFCSLRDDVSFVPSGDNGRFTTPGWSVRGGGRFRLSRMGRLLLLWGSSKAYGAFDSEAIREKFNNDVAGWEKYEIRMADPS